MILTGRYFQIIIIYNHEMKTKIKTIGHGLKSKLVLLTDPKPDWRGAVEMTSRLDCSNARPNYAQTRHSGDLCQVYQHSVQKCKPPLDYLF